MPMRSIAGSRREWLPELAVLLGLSGIAVLLFAFTDLDLVSIRRFYHAGAADPWADARRPPWSILYAAAPWITASLVVCGLGALAVGFRRGHNATRLHGLFLLLSVIVGPGLLVNFILKDHWDRPRPRDIVEFGGVLHYAPPLLPGGEGGKSFPCGHCTVGFLYASGWWVWRRRHSAWARASLAAGVVAGFALGLGRMAAGGHFLSDVVWSGLIGLGVAHALYHYALRIPSREDAAVERPVVSGARHRLRALVALAVALGGVGVLVAVFVTPHGEALAARFDLDALPRPPESLEIVAATANVEVTLVDEPRDRITVSGELHGFGLPGSSLSTSWSFLAEPSPTLRYRIVQRGWFTDLDGFARLEVPAGTLRRLVVRVERGNVRLSDRTLEHVAAGPTLMIDVQTRDGIVQLPRR